MLSDLLTKTAPKYSMKLHSNGKIIHFRPFLVREEKALLLAMEENDPGLVMKAVADIILSCCDSIGDPLELPVFDVENIFLNLRARSVSEVIHLSFEDDETGEIISEKINIDDIKLSNTPESGELKINDEIIVNLRYPILKDFVDSSVNLETSEGYYDLIAKCLTKIQTPEETIDTTTYEINEIKDFLESMNKTQFNKILKYFKNIPKYTYDLNFTNATGKTKTITLEGMQDFFGLPSATLV
jgi:hypothetical protein